LFVRVVDDDVARRTFVLLGVEMGTISLGDLDFYDLCANEVAKDFDKCYASKTWILLLSSRLSNDEFVSVLCDRIRERGRKSEKAMSRDYLTKLVVNYQKFAQELQQQVSSQDTRKRDVVAFFFNERKYASDDKNSSIFEHFKTFCDRSVKSFLATFFWWLRVSA
jgi:deoxyadenosine/deoxycytidine kinase